MLFIFQYGAPAGPKLVAPLNCRVVSLTRCQVVFPDDPGSLRQIQQLSAFHSLVVETTCTINKIYLSKKFYYMAPP